MTDRLSGAVREEVLHSLLSGHPDPWVAAIGADGFFVPMPAEVPLARHRVVEGPHSALDVVVPADRLTVVETWERAGRPGSPRR